MTSSASRRAGPKHGFIVLYCFTRGAPRTPGYSLTLILPLTMKTLETLLEQFILLSRWLLAPIYLALAAVLVLFTIKTSQEVVHLFAIITTATDMDLILAVLTLIDMALIANLLVMVILSYKSFVSSLNVGGQETPSWLGSLDMETIKVKLAVAIVAISSIHLLKAFMTAPSPGEDQGFWEHQMFWLVVIQLTFVVSALLMAVVDRIAFAQHRDH